MTTKYVNTQTAGDIAITAAEGGIGYWSQIDSYKPSRWTAGEYDNPRRVPRTFVFYSLAEQADDEKGYDWTKPVAITPEVIQRGVNLFLTGVPGNFDARGFADMSDLSAMDSAEADAVIQLGVFGKLVYG